MGAGVGVLVHALRVGSHVGCPGTPHGGMLVAVGMAVGVLVGWVSPDLMSVPPTQVMG